MRFVGLAGVGHVVVAAVVRVPGPLVLEVLLVVIGQVVLVGRRLRAGIPAGELAQELVDDMSLLVGVDVHVSNRGHFFLGDLSASSPAPVSLDSLHVPLVD